MTTQIADCWVDIVEQEYELMALCPGEDLSADTAMTRSGSHSGR
jgi:hypothetical protein